MKTRLALALVLFSLPAVAARAGEFDIPSFPGEPAPVAAPTDSYSLDTPIQKLAADQDAKTVIDRNIPGLLSNSHYPVFKTMSLRTVAAMSSGQISKETLIEVSQELGAVTPRDAKK